MLVIALVICAIGTLGVVASVSIIGVRASLADSELEVIDRRLTLRNSQALAREVVYRRYLSHVDTLDSATEYALSGGWARATIGEIDAAPLVYSDSVRIHPTGAAPYRAFSKDVEVQLHDGVSDHGVQFQLRSYSPALAGDLLSLHPTTEATAEALQVIGDLRVRGRAVFWGADYSSTTLGVRAEDFSLPLSNVPDVLLEDPDESRLLPSNYPIHGTTIGRVADGADYLGRLDIVDSDVSTANSYFDRLARVGGTVTANGRVGQCDGLGPETVAAGARDGDLIAMIADPTVPEIALVGELAASSPLSSDVMRALLYRVPAISNSYLIPLLNAQAPLPDDIMIELGRHDSPLEGGTRKTLLMNTGFSYLCDGLGGAMVNLQSVYLPNLLLEDVHHITLIGQASDAEGDDAELLDPRAIALSNGENIQLATVSLEGITNRRRVAVALAQSGVLDNLDRTDALGNPSSVPDQHTRFRFDSPIPFVSWRGVFELEGVSSIWEVGAISSGSLVGGLRTDHSIRIEGGRLNIEEETEFELLESLVSRNAWIETYKP